MSICDTVFGWLGRNAHWLRWVLLACASTTLYVVLLLYGYAAATVASVALILSHIGFALHAEAEGRKGESEANEP